MFTDTPEPFRLYLASPDAFVLSVLREARERLHVEVVSAPPADVVVLRVDSPTALEDLQRRAADTPEVAYVVLAPAELCDAALTRGATDVLPSDRRDPILLIASLRYAAERRRMRRALGSRPEEARRYQQELLELSMCASEGGELSLLRHVKAASRVLDVDRVSVWLFNEDHSEIVCSVLTRRRDGAVESGQRFRARDYPRYFQALEESRVVPAGDAHHDQRTSEFAEGYLRLHGIVSMMDVPIRLRGRLAGIVCHEHLGKPREWTLEEQEFASSIADGVALALADTRQRGVEKELFDERRFCAAVLDSTNALVAVLDAAGRVVRVNHAFNRLTGYAPGEVAGRGFAELLIVPEEVEAVRFALAKPPAPDQVVEHEHSWATKVGTRPRVAWTLAAIRAEDGEIRHLVVTGVNITERKALEEQLIHDAFHDALTGLPNRALFLDRLGQCIRQARRRPERRFAVLFLDLDRFKVINDSLGHLAGDQLLGEAARRLLGVIRPGDTVARFGGDEFTVLLDDVRVEADAIQVADRIQRVISAPLRIDGHDVVTSASIGIALGGAEYPRAEEVLRDADLAMYRAKGRGGGCHDTFDRSMHAGALTRLRIEGELRHAMERDEIVGYFQPILSLSTGRIVGFEALARWNSPTRGLVPPSEFIRLAEDSGLIIPLDRYILRRACLQIRRWRERFPRLRPLGVSVNLSGRQFVQRDLAAHVREVMQEIGIEPDCLSLEITESVLLDGSAPVAKTLQELHACGARIALDDFGTGYSSLSYLHRFPIDVLKIDRSFTSSMRPNGEGEDIVRTILTLAQGLGLQVVAEGVETQDQEAALKRLLCGFVQGFLYSRPVPAEAAEQLLEKEADTTSVPA